MNIIYFCALLAGLVLMGRDETLEIGVWVTVIAGTALLVGTSDAKER